MLLADIIKLYNSILILILILTNNFVTVLDAIFQVQHLQQQLQDANSMVRKQRVEIESFQTKLDLTTSQLHDMETALTHSAQNLNKVRVQYELAPASVGV